MTVLRRVEGVPPSNRGQDARDTDAAKAHRQLPCRRRYKQSQFPAGREWAAAGSQSRQTKPISAHGQERGGTAHAADSAKQSQFAAMGRSGPALEVDCVKQSQFSAVSGRDAQPTKSGGPTVRNKPNFRCRAPREPPSFQYSIIPPFQSPGGTEREGRRMRGNTD